MSIARPVAALAALAYLLVAASASAALYGNSYLYAGNFDDAQVQRLSVTSDGTLGVSTSYAAGLQTTALIMSPDAGALFAGSIGGARIDSYAVAADGGLSSTGQSSAAHSVDLAMTPNGAFLYGVKSDSGSSSTGTFGGFAVSGSTLTPLGTTYTLPSAHIASGVAISPDGGSLYVAASNTFNGSSGFIYRYGIDGATGLLSAPALVASGFTAGVSNLALTPDGLSLYAPSPSAGGVYQFDVTPSTGALTAKPTPLVTTGSPPYSMTVTPNGRFAYANGLFDVTGFAIHPVTGSLSSVGSPMATQFLGRFGAVSPDSKNLYVTAYPVHHFSIDPATGVLTPRGSGVSGNRFHVGLAFRPDQGPVASFTATPAPVGSASTFDASASSDSDGTVATYLWDFHDGPPVPGGPTISHTFTTPGAHTVDLTVTDDMGCSTSRTYTGHMVHCNGGSTAAQTRSVIVAPAAPVVAPPLPVAAPPPPNPTSPVVELPAPASAPVEPPTAVATRAAPSVTGLAVSRRCSSRAMVGRLSVRYSLSQDARVSYEVLRRDDSPRWTVCPRRGGTTGSTFSTLWNTTTAMGAGRHDTPIAAASTRRRPVAKLMPLGSHRVTLHGLVAGRRLTPGTHVLRVTAANANGESAVTKAKFWVIGTR